MRARVFGIVSSVLASLGWFVPASAEGLPLFSTPPASTSVLDTAEGFTGERGVVLAGGIADDLARTAGASVSIAIAPDLTVVARRRAATASSADDVVWSGDVVGDDAGSVDLVVRSGRLTGQVTAGGRTFRIEPSKGPRHRIVALDGRRAPPDEVLTPPKSALASPERTTLATPSTITVSTVRLLIGYTPGARRSVADISAEAKLAVSMANGAFRRSGVAIRLELAGLKAVKYDETGKDFSAILRAATSGTGAFADLKRARNETKADLVAVLSGLTSSCGTGWVGPAKEYAYSVVSTACLSYHSLAHELGHNLGLAHDRFVENAAPASRYNFGFVNRSARIRDIMSYADACERLGYSCTRVAMFSTPRLDYDGKRIGIAAGNPGAADAARTLNANRKLVAGFR